MIRRLYKKIRGQSKPSPKVDCESVSFASTTGFHIEASILWPPQQGKVPGVVIAPTMNSNLPFALENIARMGVAVMTFSPSGRGNSWGNEDYGGAEHQDNLGQCLRILHDHARISSIAVISCKDGLSMAIGGISLSSVPVHFLLDFEGPATKEQIYLPQSERRLDDFFWSQREPVQLIQRLTCGYIRLQADILDYRECRLLLRAAHQTELPWFQLNYHQRNTIPQEPKLLPNTTKDIERAIQIKLKLLYS